MLNKGTIKPKKQKKKLQIFCNKIISFFAPKLTIKTRNKNKEKNSNWLLRKTTHSRSAQNPLTDLWTNKNGTFNSVCKSINKFRDRTKHWDAITGWICFLTQNLVVDTVVPCQAAYHCHISIRSSAKTTHYMTCQCHIIYHVSATLAYPSLFLRFVFPNSAQNNHFWTILWFDIDFLVIYGVEHDVY